MEYKFFYTLLLELVLNILKLSDNLLTYGFYNCYRENNLSLRHSRLDKSHFTLVDEVQIFILEIHLGRPEKKSTSMFS